MKIRQAIYTSAVRTLDNRQGLGLVFSSTGLPEEVRASLPRFGYDRDADSEPIYSFERVGSPDGTWLLMNRTIPAVDYTGRTSCVSHTLALQEAEFSAFSSTCAIPVPTVFDFIRMFPWKSAWEGEPRWESPEEILTIDEALRAMPSEKRDLASRYQPCALLPFETSGTASITPRRATWKFSRMPADRILELFADIWFCVDPWRGRAPHRGLINEPEIDHLGSWSYGFTTNLRNNRPDPYHWIVLSDKFSQVPGREMISPEQWGNADPVEIRQRLLDSGLPHALMERLEQGPSNWSNRLLTEKLGEISRDFDETIRSKNDEAAHVLAGLIGDLKAVLNPYEYENEQARKEFYNLNPPDTLAPTRLKDKFNRTLGDVDRANAEHVNVYRKRSEPIESLLGVTHSVREIGSKPSPVFERETGEFDNLFRIWSERVPLLERIRRDKETLSYQDDKGKRIEDELRQERDSSAQRQRQLNDALQMLNGAEQDNQRYVVELNQLRSQIESLTAPRQSGRREKKSGARSLLTFRDGRGWMWAFFGTCVFSIAMAVFSLIQIRTVTIPPNPAAPAAPAAPVVGKKDSEAGPAEEQTKEAGKGGEQPPPNPKEKENPTKPDPATSKTPDQPSEAESVSEKKSNRQRPQSNAEDVKEEKKPVDPPKGTQPAAAPESSGSDSAVGSKEKAPSGIEDQPAIPRSSGSDNSSQEQPK